jgi:hypothetical protein
MAGKLEKNTPQIAPGNYRAADKPKVVDPIPGWRDSVSSPFGQRQNPTGGGTEFHAGIDIAKPQGTPIQAAKDGKVVFAGDGGGFGNLVVIQHNDGTYSMYAHQSQINVQVGQDVKAGDTIGKVGSTGHSTGPHLHFEVRTGGSDWSSAKAVDPVAFLNGAASLPAADPGPGNSPAASSGSSGDGNNVAGGNSPSGLGLPRAGASSGSSGNSGAGSSGSSSGPQITRTIPAAPPAGAAAPRSLAVKEQAVADAIKGDPEIQAAFADWANLTAEQKLAIARKIAKLMGKAFGFVPQGNIRFDRSLGKDGTLGITTPDAITLSQAALSDPKQFVDTLIHEETHVYDIQSGAGLAAPNHNVGDVEDGIYKVGHAVRNEAFAP